MTCILCAGQLDVINNSGICRECLVIVHNLLDVRIEEQWRPAVGQVDHIVSDRGRVARLLPVVGGHRYPRVSIGREKRYIHVMVAEAFHGPRPDGLLALHADDDPDRPHAENLSWGSHAQNYADAVRNGRIKTSAAPGGREEEMT